MAEVEWEPLSPESVAALDRPFVAEGFLRLNKPALARLLQVLGTRSTGQRDLGVLLGLLLRAGFSGGTYKSSAEGAVGGTDAELARLVGVDRSAFRRAVDDLVDRGYLERLDTSQPVGYRIRKPVWEWLQAPDMPPAPAALDERDPFSSVRTGKPRGTGTAAPDPEDEVHASTASPSTT